MKLEELSINENQFTPLLTTASTSCQDGCFLLGDYGSAIYREFQLDRQIFRDAEKIETVNCKWLIARPPCYYRE